jgi:hypothetical protein
MGGADYYSQLGLDPTYGEYLEVSDTSIPHTAPFLFGQSAQHLLDFPLMGICIMCSIALASRVFYCFCVQEGIREFGDPGVVLPRPDEVVMATEPMGEGQYDYDYYWPGDFNYTASSGPPLG